MSVVTSASRISLGGPKGEVLEFMFDADGAVLVTLRWSEKNKGTGHSEVPASEPLGIWQPQRLIEVFRHLMVSNSLDQVRREVDGPILSLTDEELNAERCKVCVARPAACATCPECDSRTCRWLATVDKLKKAEASLMQAMREERM